MPRRQPNNYDIKIGRNVQRLRESLNITQERAGRFLKVTRQQFHKYESGLPISASALCELKSLFSCEIADFYKGID